ncbi:MAG: FKBP-type peptidyl-prolyl cis-trans isomerase [Anaerolineales bacterium]|nr:FKBP-type peptidyl-prolyl cis-trans isomerase [Anaerolineales bacterium]MCB9172754.1 FKBP-type peptidyl-prolyl cis-trans isomerase [Ardenticatenales bacterium]
MKRRLMILLLGAMMLLAACGTSDTTETDGTSGTETSEATSPPAGTENTDVATPLAVTPLPTLAIPALSEGFTTTESGLQIKDVVEGEGDGATLNDIVSMNYTGWLEDGTQFDSNVGGNPFPVTLGAGTVIDGWEEGLQGMKAGGKRILIIPSELGYGENGSGALIPPDATLVFEVEMLSIEKQPSPTDTSSADFTDLEVGGRYTVLAEGEGETANVGQLVEVSYVSWFENGVLFAEKSEEDPVLFRLGKSGVETLDAAIEGMKVGGTRQIIVPENEDAVAQGMPEGETIFEVTLLAVKETPVMQDVEPSQFSPTDNGVQIAVVEAGEGAEAALGDTVTVDYSGFLEDGSIFDSSVETGRPFTFALMEGSAIPGWIEGIQGMKVGEKRQIRIPPEQGYGEVGAGDVIPPNSTLIFDVEMIEIVPAAPDSGNE